MTTTKFGLCQGVNAALKKANAATGEKIYLYGDIINNRHVMEDFRNRGYIVTDEIGEIEADSTVIIRAHGLPRAAYEQLKGMRIEDCTCPKVKHIHHIVEKADQVIIVGSKTHPEVVGHLGWCKNGVVVESVADLEKIDLNGDICVVGQTTCKKNLWEDVTAQILKLHPTAKIHNTLCNAVMERIEEATEIARAANYVVAIGDKKSANSTALFNACKNVCENTYFVSGIEDFVQAEEIATTIKSNETIAFVGSASAPPEIVQKTHDCFVFQKFLADAKKEIEGYAFTQKNNTPIVNEAIADLFEQNEGGKRIRGAMVKLGALAASSVENYLPVAYAYELFQTAILIHDDIIDRSQARRGKTTIHEKNADKHFGISRAICIGDYGLFLANKIMSAATGGKTLEAMQYFSDIQLSTLEGELMDVTLPYEPIDLQTNYDNYMDTVREIFRTKTAIYTLAGPLKLGAIFGGATSETAEALYNLAIPLGIAFQIKDDLLGMYADDKTIGKPAISDLHEKKQTLLYGYAYKHATDEQRVTLDRLYGNPTATQADLATVRDIFTTTGATTFGQKNIHDLSQESLQAIEQLQTGENIKTLLRGLVYYLTVRRY